MAITPEQVAKASLRWGLAEIAAPVTDRLAAYGNLLLQWNTRISLTAIRDEAELIERHLMEGVFAAAHHPEAATALDFGSGNGVPGIPVALCRASIHVTLAESQRKKGCIPAGGRPKLNLRASVHAGRAETLPPASFTRYGCAQWTKALRISTSGKPGRFQGRSLSLWHLSAAGCASLSKLAVEKSSISRRKCPCFAHWATNVAFHVEHVTLWLLTFHVANTSQCSSVPQCLPQLPPTACLHPNPLRRSFVFNV